MLRRGMTYLVLLTAGFGGTALAQKTPQDKAANNRKEAEALREEAKDDYHKSELELRRMKELLEDAKKSEKIAAEDRKNAKTLQAEGEATLAAQQNQQAALEDQRAKMINEDAAKKRQKADSLLADARAAWQKSQDLEKTPCLHNLPYCAPEPTHPVKK